MMTAVVAGLPDQNIANPTMNVLSMKNDLIRDGVTMKVRATLLAILTALMTAIGIANHQSQENLGDRGM